MYSNGIFFDSVILNSIKPTNDLSVTALPDPASPTNPTISPSLIENEISFTALIILNLFLIFADWFLASKSFDGSLVLFSTNILLLIRLFSHYPWI